jgi:hypothetical protein
LLFLQPAIIHTNNNTGRILFIENFFSNKIFKKCSRCCYKIYSKTQNA